MLRYLFTFNVAITLSLTLAGLSNAQEEQKKSDAKKDRVYLSSPDKAKARPKPHIYQAPPAADTFKAPAVLNEQKVEKEEPQDLATDSVKESSSPNKKPDDAKPQLPISNDNLDPDDDEPMD